MRYRILAIDPGGLICTAEWATEHLPRIGEKVLLPRGEEAAHWQELSVVEVLHHPDAVEISLGGTTGWEPGSVAPLFEYARRFMGQAKEAT